MIFKKIVKKLIYIIAFSFLFLSGCGVENIKPDSKTCKKADNINFVESGNGCLAIDFGRRSIPNYPMDNLIIGLHGDNVGKKDSSGVIRPSYLASKAKKNSVIINLVRPGYCGQYDNCSSGYNHNGYAKYTNLDVKMLSNAIINLKKHYKPKKVILVGQSSGSALSALIVGKSKKLVDSMILAACPCSYDEWRFNKGRKPKISLDPINYVANIDIKTKIYLFVGSDDANTMPSVSKSYFDKAKKYGLDISLSIMPGEDHSSVKKTDKFYHTIESELIGGNKKSNSQIKFINYDYFGNVIPPFSTQP